MSIGGGPRAVGVRLQPPAVLVDQTVVEGAQQTAVGDDGRPTVDTELEVVGVTLAGWSPTGRKHAVAIARGQRTALAWAEPLGRRVGVEHPLAVEEGGHKGAVAEQPTR